MGLHVLLTVSPTSTFFLCSALFNRPKRKAKKKKSLIFSMIPSWLLSRIRMQRKAKKKGVILWASELHASQDSTPLKRLATSPHCWQDPLEPKSELVRQKQLGAEISAWVTVLQFPMGIMRIAHFNLQGIPLLKEKPKRKRSVFPQKKSEKGSEPEGLFPLENTQAPQENSPLAPGKPLKSSNSLYSDILLYYLLLYIIGYLLNISAY